MRWYSKWYFNGTYLKQDYQQAFNWLHQAAAAKSAETAESAYLLVQFYAQGIGMDRDPKQALYFLWYGRRKEIYKGLFDHRSVILAAVYANRATAKWMAGEELSLGKSRLYRVSDKNNKKLAQQLLLKIQTEMPPAWQDEPDEKVKQHLAKP